MTRLMKLERLRGGLSAGLSVTAVLLVMLTSLFGQFTNLIQRPLFLLLIIVLGYALFPSKEHPSKVRGAVDIGLAILCGLACLAVIVRADEIITSLPEANVTDTISLTAIILALLVLMVRIVGWAFPIMIVLSLIYSLYGNLVPGALGHRGLDTAFMVESLYLGDLGLWGMLTGVAATTIAPFVLFGAMVLCTGGGQAFMEFAMRISGRSPGGAAKMATIASSLFGMISGSAVANVATTGNLTIPLMNRLGYPPRLAGGVEAVASTGGQLAPPIMGAAAFVMAELVGVGYQTIALAALIPAILFYASLFIIIHIVAERWKLPLVPKEEMPSWSSTLDPKRLMPLLGGLVVLIGAIFNGRSISFSATLGTVVILALFLGLNVRSQQDAKVCMGKIMEGVRDAGNSFVTITILLAGAQILVTVINLTGFGVNISSSIVSQFSSMPLLAPVVVALACLILGMGVPTTAAYILVASILAPAMIRIGFEPLATHLFVLYYAALSAITPPVCVAAFVAAGIAKTSWFSIAKEAMRLSSIIYLIPFAFLFMPGLLAQGGWENITDSVARASIATFAIAALASGGALLLWHRLGVLVYGAIAILALYPAIETLIASLILAIGAEAIRRHKKSTLLS